jgi:hypothetical protein
MTLKFYKISHFLQTNFFLFTSKPGNLGHGSNCLRNYFFLKQDQQSNRLKGNYELTFIIFKLTFQFGRKKNENDLLVIFSHDFGHFLKEAPQVGLHCKNEPLNL